MAGVALKNAGSNSRANGSTRRRVELSAKGLLPDCVIGELDATFRCPASHTPFLSRAMKHSIKLFGFFLLFGLVATAGPKHEESVFLFENRKLGIAVPAGFGYNSIKDD